MKRSLVFILFLCGLSMAFTGSYSPTNFPNGVSTGTLNATNGLTVGTTFVSTIGDGFATINGPLTATSISTTGTVSGSALRINGNGVYTGTVSANSFVGDGSQLTNVQISTGNITLTGNLTAVNGTFSGTVSASALQVNGKINISNTTGATTTTDGSIQSEGGLSIVKDIVLGGNVINPQSQTGSSRGLYIGRTNIGLIHKYLGNYNRGDLVFANNDAQSSTATATLNHEVAVFKNDGSFRFGKYDNLGGSGYGNSYTDNTFFNVLGNANSGVGNVYGMAVATTLNISSDPSGAGQYGVYVYPKFMRYSPNIPKGVAIYSSGKAQDTGVLTTYALWAEAPTGGLANYGAYISGNVGINKPTPSTALEVAGTVSANQFGTSWTSFTPTTNPSVVSYDVSFTSAYYQKIGKTVNYSVYFSTGSTGGGASGNVVIGGFPIPIKNNTRFIVGSGFYGSNATASPNIAIYNSASEIALYKNLFTNLTGTDTGTSGQRYLYVTGVYETP